MAAIERQAYSLGYTPSDFYLLTFREALQVSRSVRYENFREQEFVRARTAEVIAAIINYGGMVAPDSPVNPREILSGEAGTKMSEQRLNANYERHAKRLRKEQARRQREADPSIET